MRKPSAPACSYRAPGERELEHGSVGLRVPLSNEHLAEHGIRVAPLAARVDLAYHGLGLGSGAPPASAPPRPVADSATELLIAAATRGETSPVHASCGAARDDDARQESADTLFRKTFQGAIRFGTPIALHVAHEARPSGNQRLNGGSPAALARDCDGKRVAHI